MLFVLLYYISKTYGKTFDLFTRVLDRYTMWHSHKGTTNKTQRLIYTLSSAVETRRVNEIKFNNLYDDDFEIQIQQQGGEVGR
jgi:hypothetical protein